MGGEGGEGGEGGGGGKREREDLHNCVELKVSKWPTMHPVKFRVIVQLCVHNSCRQLKLT